ncbi:MAG: M23 family metallopeptidase [Alphaproteobacteria bacterium]|nr:M23 family metallopeptidase [Alphaproteobacteria bacterium]
MNRKILFFVAITSLPIAAPAAKSFLSPQTFPTTVADLSFADKQNLKIDGYEEYSGMTPYHYFQLVENEAGLQDEVEEETKEEPTINEEKIEKLATTAPTEYCKNASPNIPFGQKIPLGNPTTAPTKICSRYGWRVMGTRKDGSKINDPHYGIDIGCNPTYFDTPIYATADGVVESVTSAKKCKSAGNYVKIRHDSGFITMYMHLNSITVKRGQRVHAGCQIGTMGHSGGAKVQSCPKMGKDLTHLHYQIGYAGSQRSITTPSGKTIKLEGLNGKSFKYSVNPTEFFFD